MKIVVADTSPVRYQAEIGQLDLLRKLFETVLIPTVVFQELQHPASPEIVRETVSQTADWLKVVTTNIVNGDPVLSALDGERAALHLCISVKADLLLIDERRGAAAARIKGVEFTGTLGVLIRAAERQWIDLADTFTRLRGTNFYCPEALMQILLARYGTRS